MFALCTLAEETGQDLEIFSDQSYKHLNHIVLSTSTLSADSVLIGGFGPVTSDGYGIGYNVSISHYGKHGIAYHDICMQISSENIGYNVLTYPSRDGAQFVACLHDTLDDLHCLMTGKNFK